MSRCKVVIKCLDGKQLRSDEALFAAEAPVQINYDDILPWSLYVSSQSYSYITPNLTLRTEREEEKRLYEPDFVEYSGAQESIPWLLDSLEIRALCWNFRKYIVARNRVEILQGCLTGPPGYIGRWNRFLDSLKVYKYVLWTLCVMIGYCYWLTSVQSQERFDNRGRKNSILRKYQTSMLEFQNNP